MKRFLIMLLCLSLMLCVFASCGDDDTDNSSNKNGEGNTLSDNSDAEGSTPDDTDEDEKNDDTEEELEYQYDMKKYVTLPKYAGYNVTVMLDEIQRQIDSYILSCAEKSKKLVCMTGDVVDVTYFGYRLDANGDILYEDIFSESDNYGVYLGSNLALEAFEKGIVGMKIGDIREIYLTFPDDYFEQNLAGERVMFEVILNAIYDPPLYNDEFVKKFMPDYNSTSELEKDLENQVILDEIYDYVRENSTILSYPEKEYKKVAKELDELAKELLENNDIKLDEYIEKKFGMTREEYIKYEMKEKMVFYAIAQAEGISPTESELKQERELLINHYTEEYVKDGVDYRQAVLLAQDFVNDLGDSYVYENVIYEKIDKKLVSLANVTKEPKSYKSVTQYLFEKQNAKTGNEVGDLCPSFEAEVFDEGGSLSTTIDPTKNFGKLTVINFWGTWCGPCKIELPDFDRVASKYRDQVTIFAVHSSNNFKEASEYVLDNFVSSDIIFLKDVIINPNDQYSDDMFYKLLGGANYYPYTVILDENGVIRATHVGMLSYDQLVEMLENIGLEK